MFTDAEHYPLVYTHNDQSWNFYELGSSEPRYFFSLPLRNGNPGISNSKHMTLGFCNFGRIESVGLKKRGLK